MGNYPFSGVERGDSVLLLIIEVNRKSLCSFSLKPGFCPVPTDLSYQSSELSICDPRGEDVYDLCGVTASEAFPRHVLGLLISAMHPMHISWFVFIF